MSSEEFTRADRDLLVRLQVTLETFITEMRQGNQNTLSQLTDHEARIRVLQASNERQEGSMKTMRTVGIILSAVISAAISLAGLFIRIK